MILKQGIRSGNPAFSEESVRRLALKSGLDPKEVRAGLMQLLAIGVMELEERPGETLVRLRKEPLP